MNTEPLQCAFEALVRKAYDIAVRPFVERRDSAGLLIIAAQRDYILSFNVRTFLRPPYTQAFAGFGSRPPFPPRPPSPPTEGAGGGSR